MVSRVVSPDEGTHADAESVSESDQLFRRAIYYGAHLLPNVLDLLLQDIGVNITAVPDISKHGPIEGLGRTEPAPTRARNAITGDSSYGRQS